MKLADQLDDWTETIDGFLATHGLTRKDITSAVDVWTVAHRTGIWSEAYDLGAKDAHMQTALERIFPHVTFGDPKRY